MHLGLIGGIGPAATEFYYRGLVSKHAAAGKKLELTIVQAEVGTLLENLMRGASELHARIFAELIDRLKGAGADIAAITSLAGHFCLKDLKPISALPIDSAIDALAAHLHANGLTKVGMLGTSAVMRSGFYGGIDGVDLLAPDGDDLDAVHDAYTTMARAGAATDEQRDLFFDVGRQMCTERGAQAVILAGTDLFLAFDGEDCGIPVIDAAQVHIDRLASLSIG